MQVERAFTASCERVSNTWEPTLLVHRDYEIIKAKPLKGWARGILGCWCGKSAPSQ